MEAFPVRTSVWPVEETDSTESGLDCSLNSCGSYAWFDLASLSWKMYQRSLLGGWESFSDSWPRQGLMLNGAVYPQQEWEPHIFVSESSLWPTPTASPTRPCEGNVRLLRTKVLVGDIQEPEAMAMLNGKSPLEAQGKLPASYPRKQVRWPTPTTQDAANNGGPSQYRRNSLPLNAAAGGSLNPEWVEWLMGFPAGWTDLEPSETP